MPEEVRDPSNSCTLICLHFRESKLSGFIKNSFYLQQNIIDVILILANSSILLVHLKESANVLYTPLEK